MFLGQVDDKKAQKGWSSPGTWESLCSHSQKKKWRNASPVWPWGGHWYVGWFIINIVKNLIIGIRTQAQNTRQGRPVWKQDLHTNRKRSKRRKQSNKSRQWERLTKWQGKAKYQTSSARGKKKTNKIHQQDKMEDKATKTNERERGCSGWKKVRKQRRTCSLSLNTRTQKQQKVKGTHQNIKETKLIEREREREGKERGRKEGKSKLKH